MNEQELTDKAEAFVRDQGNTHSGLADRPRIICWMSSFAKAYADAQVEASVARQQPIFEAAMNAKNAEIAELKAILTKILALPDDTAAAYIKALIHDQIKLK